MDYIVLNNRGWAPVFLSIPIFFPNFPALYRLMGMRVNWSTYGFTIYNWLIKRGVEKIYHFTDWSNLDSIENWDGLHSWQACENFGIKVLRPGGNQLSHNLDQNKGTLDYVHCSFTPRHPMMYAAINDNRIDQPVILSIDLDFLVRVDDILFSYGNAARNDTVISSKINILQDHDFQFLQSWNANHGNIYNKQLKFQRQSEIMIKGVIPWKFITATKI